MNENTTRVAAVPVKQVAGEYTALTYGGGHNGYEPTGAFTFRKVSGSWWTNHLDYTNPDGVTSLVPQKTLKAAHEAAERHVRNLTNNLAGRREAALRGAMPIGSSVTVETVPLAPYVDPFPGRDPMDAAPWAARVDGKVTLSAVADILKVALEHIAKGTDYDTDVAFWTMCHAVTALRTEFPTAVGERFASRIDAIEYSEPTLQTRVLNEVIAGMARSL